MCIVIIHSTHFSQALSAPYQSTAPSSNKYEFATPNSSMGSSSIPFQSTVNRSPIGETLENPRSEFPKLVKLSINSRKSRSLSTTFCLTTGNDGFRREKLGVGEKDGVIIVDHGSRRRESNLMLNQFVDMYRNKTGYRIVEPAHMELAEPSIRDAFNLCVQQGANRVIVSPYFLFPGRHWQQDIPSLTAEAAKEHLGISYLITAPLGLHELMVDVVNDTINHCLSHIGGDAEECVVCAGTGKCRLY